MSKCISIKGTNTSLLLLGMTLFWQLNYAQQFSNCQQITLPTTTDRVAINVPNPICPNTRIVIPTAANLSNVRYVYDFKQWSDTTKAVTTNTTVYSQSGNYLVVQLGRRNGRNTFGCMAVQVLTVTPPQIALAPCGNATVTLSITNLASLNYIIYNINWGDGTPNGSWVPGAALPTHTYTTTSPVNVQVTGLYLTPVCSANSAPVAYLLANETSQLPQWSKVEVLDQNNVEIAYQTNPNAPKFTLQQRTSTTPTFSTVGTAPTLNGNENRVRISNLNTTANLYIYRNSLSTTCANRPITVNSSEIATVSLQPINTQPYQNQLIWRPYSSGVRRYRILRDGQELANVGATQTTYVDTKVECGKTYKYQVVADFSTTPVASSYSIVREAITQPTTSPTPITNALVTIQNNRATVTAVTLPTGVRIARYKAIIDGREWLSTTRVMVDTASRPLSGQHCYQLTYEDACGRSPAPTQKICTVFLENKGETLRWTPELPFTGQLRGYFVDKLNSQGAVVRTYNVGLDNQWPMDPDDPQQEVTYRVRAVSMANLTSVSNTVTLVRAMKLFVATAFTPDGDGINDNLTIQGQFVQQATLSIYDRWGHGIYQTTDWKKGWPGTTAGGQPVEANTYVYQLTATDTKGKVSTQRGLVQLIR